MSIEKGSMSADEFFQAIDKSRGSDVVYNPYPSVETLMELMSSYKRPVSKMPERTLSDSSLERIVRSRGKSLVDLGPGTLLMPGDMKSGKDKTKVVVQEDVKGDNV